VGEKENAPKVTLRTKYPGFESGTKRCEDGD